MHRSRKRRLSRTAIAITAAALIVGAILAFHNWGSAPTPERAVAADTQPLKAPPATAPADATARSDTQMAAASAVTQTPSAPIVPVALTQTQAAGAAAPSPATRPTAAISTNSGDRLAAPQAVAAMQQADVKLKAGDLLEARRLYNEALQSGSLNPADLANAKAAISHISQKVVFSSERFADDPYGGTFTVPPGGVLAKIAQRYTVPWELLAHINGITPRSLRAGQTIKIIQGPFHAVVNKSAFTLDLYLRALPGQKGSMYVTTLPVGLGQDNSTPTGLWDVGGKLKNPKFWGLADMKPVEGGAPDNPLGKYWIALIGIDGHAVGKESYGIHGTNDPKTIGTMCSHGCIRLRDADIALVFSCLDSKKSTVLVEK